MTDSAAKRRRKKSALELDESLRSRLDAKLASSKRVSIKTLTGSMQAMLAADLFTRRDGNLLVICGDKAQAETVFGDLNVFMGDQDHLCLYTEGRKHLALELEQLDTRFIGLTAGINVLSTQKRALVVADAEALGFKIPSPDSVHSNLMTVRREEELSFEDFTGILALNGFDRKDFVENVGDVAVRGGIVDVYPPGADNPYRIEFFGDEVDSIREFDPLSQRSIREFNDITFIGSMFAGDEAEQTSTIFDYLDKNTLLFIIEPEDIEARLTQLAQADKPSIEPARLDGYKQVRVNPLGRVTLPVDSSPQPATNASIKKLCHELRRLTALEYRIILTADGKDQLQRLLDLIESAFEVDDDELDGLGQLEDDHPETNKNGFVGVGEEHLADVDETLQRLTSLPIVLSEGFVYHDDRLAVLTEHQIFERRRAKRSRGSSKNVGFTVRELQQLRPGDFVVHVDKGVAQFDGLETITVGGTQQDCVRLIFNGGDKMFVHLNYINRLQMYSAQEGIAPKLSKLGGKEWERKKARAKSKLKDIARDLIKLYAERKMKPGMAFPPDTLWQKEMEASFMYEDTPDQAKTTAELKRDMERSEPMDRLVCGDVGFGKTEVAIRAAFKAVQAGKQVAVLVPTTILAQQHFETFRDRLSRYAVNVEVISRFRTRAEQRVILENLKKGVVDILIGTHRILSKDIEFRSLGLLIIDEEQRFGVGAKEKLRHARAAIDTLTLTATPIPRTLNFSLLGARDISVIATAPRNRIPIHTEIMPWNGDVLREAIQSELDRGGQVFMVNDRIGNLEDLAEQLRELVPDLRISVAHGQMEGSQLERIMRDFIERKADVLIATKIIESGIDIPNVNTMLINRADRFGLAELYQLRGRVGRSNIQAHCYLLIPPPHSISRKALRRLQALEEFTELGSGFNLAMRDLEIRGAGNLLGAEQSGFIADIGFEMYQKIVDEAVAEIKEEEFADLFKEQLDVGKKRPKLAPNRDITIEIEGDALLDKDYISVDVDRYEFYKRLYTLEKEEDLMQIIDEMRDRFGSPPEKAQRLFAVIRLRIASMPLGFESVTWKHGVLKAELPPNDRKEFYDRVFQSLITTVTNDPDVKMAPKGAKIFVHVKTPSIEAAVLYLRRLADQTLRSMAEHMAAAAAEA